MSQKFVKLKTLLKELFQLDQPDLDFGFYPDPNQWQKPEIRDGWQHVQATLQHPLLAHWIARLDGQGAK